MGQITSHLESQRVQFEDRLDEVARHADEAAQSSFDESKRREQSLKAEMAEASQSRVAFSLGAAPESAPASPINQGVSERSPINQDSSARRITLAGISDKNFEYGDSIPKYLTNGDSLTATFDNKNQEDVVQFIQQVEFELRLANPTFWTHMVISKALGAKVKASATLFGLTLLAGRSEVLDSTGTLIRCAANWGPWDELKAWLMEQYYKPSVELKKLQTILYELKQLGSLESYINAFETKLAACNTAIDEDLQKAIFLHNMKPDTRFKVMEEPDILAMPFKEFKNRATTHDDNLFAHKRDQKKKNPRHPAPAAALDEPVADGGGYVAAVRTGKARGPDAMTAEGNARHC